MWFEPLSQEATVIPFVCDHCATNPTIVFSCTACNRSGRKPHRDLIAEHKEHAQHCDDCIAEGVAYRSFARVVYCWCCANYAPDPSYKCGKLATQIKRWPKHCDCPACWQTFYHVCDEHAATWIEDLPLGEQKTILRSRGAEIVEYPDGSWSTRWPMPVDN
jgi:hypothetical protein